MLALHHGVPVLARVWVMSCCGRNVQSYYAGAGISSCSGGTRRVFPGVPSSTRRSVYWWQKACDVTSECFTCLWAFQVNTNCTWWQCIWWWYIRVFLLSLRVSGQRQLQMVVSSVSDGDTCQGFSFLSVFRSGTTAPMAVWLMMMCPGADGCPGVSSLQQLPWLAVSHNDDTSWCFSCTQECPGVFRVYRYGWQCVCDCVSTPNERFPQCDRVKDGYDPLTQEDLV